MHSHGNSPVASHCLSRFSASALDPRASTASFRASCNQIQSDICIVSLGHGLPRGLGQVGQGVETALAGRLFQARCSVDNLALPPLDNGEHVLGPPRQCGAYFVLIAIPIVDRFNAALDVIDRELGDVRRNA